MPDFDAARFKQMQRDQWNEAVAAWPRWGSTFQSWFGKVTTTMLDLGRVRPGDRVVDIAAGTGEAALGAAERVGAQGYVLATDLSENMIVIARQIAEQRQLQHVETRTMDGENLDLPDDAFDVVLCRFGLMLMPNQQRALSEWFRVLKPGGRVVVVVYSTAEKNPWGSVPIAVIQKHAHLPPPLPEQPGMFSLGADGVLLQALRQAQFQDVEVRALSAPLRMQSARECMRFERESIGMFNQMMAHLSAQERESIWDEAEQAMRQFESPDGFAVPCELLIGVGAKP